MQPNQIASPEARPTNPKRQLLKEISATAKTAVQFGKAESVNEAIIDIYKAQGLGQVFKTFKEWTESGFSIKKGEKALLVWGRPRTKKQDDEKDGYSFFPIAFVFSELQVIDNSKNLNIVGEPGQKYGCSEIQISYKKSDYQFALPIISNSKQANELLKPFYKNIEHHESFYVLFLNHGAKPIGVYHHSTGGTASTVVDVKIILQTALKCHASSMILSHNHPSGNLQPSEIDLKLTTRIKNAAELLDISVRDHLILTHSEYYSFADEGRM